MLSQNRSIVRALGAINGWWCSGSVSLKRSATRVGFVAHQLDSSIQNMKGEKSNQSSSVCQERAGCCKVTPWDNTGLELIGLFDGAELSDITLARCVCPLTRWLSPYCINGTHCATLLNICILQFSTRYTSLSGEELPNIYISCFFYCILNMTFLLYAPCAMFPGHSASCSCWNPGSCASSSWLNGLVSNFTSVAGQKAAGLLDQHQTGILHP